MNTPTDQASRSVATPLPPALWRRLAAAFYDGLVVLGIYIFATFLIVPFFPRGQALDSFYVDHPGVKLIYQFVLLALGFLFFGGFWVRNGQTLGMLAWKIKVVQTTSGDTITWKQALLRYLAAFLSWLPLGLGFIWSLFDPGRRTWHDMLSGTELRMAPSFTKLSNPDSGADNS